MSFRKPFRAVPMKLGRRYWQRAATERASEIAVIMIKAAAVGVVIAFASVVYERPIRLAAQALTADPRTIAAREASVRFAGCDDARQAGAAPIYAGEPGYRPEMDGDSDGVACEPYR